MARSIAVRGLPAVVAAVLSISPVVVGCEEDPLAPTPNFTPSECIGPHCDLVDAGVTPDSGVEPDVGIDAGEWADATAFPDAQPSDNGVLPDAGIWPDATAPDSGIWPDASTPQDSGTIADFLNLAGTHDTEYLFDWSAYLFGIGSQAELIDTLAQIVSGNIDTGFPPLDALIRSVVQQYVPPWVVTLLNVLNGIANFFDEVEVTGVMNLAQDFPTPGPNGPVCVLHGSETWTTLTVHLINLCPRGRQDPNYPACARQRIAIVPRGHTGVGPLEVEVEVDNFDGVLEKGRPQANFVLNDRDVDVDLYKLVRIAIDIGINLGTNGQVPSLEAALNRLIDCPGLELQAYNLAVNFGLGPLLAQAAATSVRQVCDDKKDDVIDAVLDGLNGIRLSIVEFEFDQIGHAVDTNGNHRPEKLQVMATPRTIDGRFRLIASDRLRGRWEGTNRAP